MTILSVFFFLASNSASAECVKQVVLKWEAPKVQRDGKTPLTEIKGYKVYVQEELKKMNLAKPKIVDVKNANQLLLSDLKKGRKYRLSVSAYNSQGEGEKSEDTVKTVCK